MSSRNHPAVLTRELELSRAAYARLYVALRKLVVRCDGAEGVRADGSNICTYEAHAALGDFDVPEFDEATERAAVRRAFNEEYPS